MGQEEKLEDGRFRRRELESRKVMSGKESQVGLLSHSLDLEYCSSVHNVLGSIPRTEKKSGKGKREHDQEEWRGR